MIKEEYKDTIIKKFQSVIFEENKKRIGKKKSFYHPFWISHTDEDRKTTIDIEKIKNNIINDCLDFRLIHKLFSEGKISNKDLDFIQSIFYLSEMGEKV